MSAFADFCKQAQEYTDETQTCDKCRWLSEGTDTFNCALNPACNFQVVTGASCKFWKKCEGAKA